MTNISESENSETASIVEVLSDFLEKVDENKNEDSSKNKPLKKRTIYDVLAVSEDVAQEIFDCLRYEDYTTLRLISKPFRKFHDDYIIRIPCNIFPGFTGFLFENWYAQETLVAHLKHRLKPLVKVVIEVQPHVQKISIPELTKYSLKEIAMRLIKSTMSNFGDETALKLANAFFKLNVLSLDDFCNFSRKKRGISKACSLGLTTLVRELSIRDIDNFIRAIGPTGEGLLHAIMAKRYETSRFIIYFIRSHLYEIKDSEIMYLEVVIFELIKAKYWDLFYEYYEMNQEKIPHQSLLNIIADNGYIEGLIVVRNLSITHFCIPGMLSKAAFNGHWEFLQEIDSMGLIQEYCEVAIHDAASNGHTEFLEFLVSRFGTEYLGVEDKNGYLPIHLAVKRGNTVTLRAILRLYPSYEYSTSRSPQRQVISPLNAAIRFGVLENVKILLEHFPELINFKNCRNETVIHLAVIESSVNILQFLLKMAPIEIITARNIDGDTALHLGHGYHTCYKIHALLMGTNFFTGWKRNNACQTPIGVYGEKKFLTDPNIRSKLMGIFKINTEEEYKDALRTVTNTTI